MLGRGIPFPPFFKLKGHPPIATGNRCPGLDYAAGIRDVGVDRGLSHRQEHSRFPLPIVPGLTSKTCVQGRWCLVRKLLFSAFSAFFCFCSFYFLLPAVIFFKPSAKPLHDLLAGFASVRKQSAVPATPLPPFQGESVGGGGRHGAVMWGPAVDGDAPAVPRPQRLHPRPLLGVHHKLPHGACLPRPGPLWRAPPPPEPGLPFWGKTKNSLCF